MAPFNQRQIGYIQAIAGRQQHRTLICKNVDNQISSLDTITATHKPQALNHDLVYGNAGDSDRNNFTTEDPAKSLLLHTWFLESATACHTSSTDHNDDAFTIEDLQNLAHSSRGAGKYLSLEMFSAAVQGTLNLDVTETATHGIDNLGGGSLTNHTHDYYKSTLSDPTASGELVKNPDRISSIHRATPDGFLNSTTLKFRFTLPQSVAAATHSTPNPMGQDHYEFRWIVWRNKRPTFRYNVTTADKSNLDLIRQGGSFRNPNYDFFMGQTGRKRGLLGYTYHPELDKDKMTSEGQASTEKYSGARLTAGSSGDWTDVEEAKMWPTGEDGMTVDDLLTMPLNKEDYVVMKDVRFFLGKEHGKSHFEDTLHWDWNDPIDTLQANVLTSPTLNDKNYRWNITLIGTSGGLSPCVLNYSLRGTTKMESG